MSRMTTAQADAMNRAPAPPASEDALATIDELAARASRTQRANTPRYLVFLALAGFALAFVFLMLSMARRNDARDTLALQRANAEQIVALAARLDQVRQASGAGAESLLEADPQLRSRISQAGSAAGLVREPAIPTELPATRTPDGRGQQRKLQYRISDPSLGAITSWLTLVERTVPGVRVFRVSLTPDAEQWSAEIIFTRLERID
jgi:hypothetical protein